MKNPPNPLHLWVPILSMIHYIKGAITHKSPAFILIETSGVGYQVFISLHTYGQIEKLETVKILIHEYIKEDSHTLFGFADDSERILFQQLISVSGIGPTTAQLVLSSLSPDEIRSAIVGEHDHVFNRIRGIGPKTAKRIILDLKDKVSKEAGEVLEGIPMADNTIREEALSALVALGFNRIQVQKTLNQLLKQLPGPITVEQLIKAALQQLT